ncbi:MAG: heme ABC transporter ATP-binding protein [Bacteroidota bacterium]|nr:heme ABC transporter ATP-binding protein [Bacteroidota bacterium]
MIDAVKVSYFVRNTCLVDEVSFSAKPGEFVVIMGPNGAGKSTLLKMLSGSLVPHKGTVTCNGKQVKEYPASSLAKIRAVLSQQYSIGFPIEAREVVMMGRYPHFANYPTREDEAYVTAAMDRMEVGHLAQRDYHSLSGGEAQKIQMCRVLAQLGDSERNAPHFLFLDEPVSHLDIKYQHQLLKEARFLTDQQVIVIAVLHDLNLALQYADRILFLKEGKLVGTVSETSPITTELIKKVFDVDGQILTKPDGKGLLVSF